MAEAKSQRTLPLPAAERPWWWEWETAVLGLLVVAIYFTRLTAIPVCGEESRWATAARKETDAPEVVVWGSGRPRREFLHVDDLADAVVFLMQNYDDPEIVNVGTGTDISIRDLATMIQEVVGYSGTVRFDPSQPDGTPRKVLDLTKLNSLGWRATISLADGLRATYRWFLQHKEGLRNLPASQPMPCAVK